MDKIVLVTFKDAAYAYKAYADISASMGATGYTVHEMALVKNENGTIIVPDNYATGQDNGNDTLYGGLIGGVVGILGGPVGVLLGLSFGLLIGAAIDTSDTSDDDSLLLWVSGNLKDGQTALVAYVSEDEEIAFNSNFIDQDVTIHSWDASEVEAEVNHAIKMQDELARQAHEKVREEKKAERARRRAEREANNQIM